MHQTQTVRDLINGYVSLSSGSMQIVRSVCVDVNTYEYVLRMRLREHGMVSVRVLCTGAHSSATTDASSFYMLVQGRVLTAFRAALMALTPRVAARSRGSTDTSQLTLRASSGRRP
jgi:hypothetical protein